MKIKYSTIIVTAVLAFSLIAASPAQAIIDPVSLAVIGFTALATLITGSEATKNTNNESMAKQEVKDNVQASNTVVK
jgi:hypothetical protein